MTKAEANRDIECLMNALTLLDRAYVGETTALALLDQMLRDWRNELELFVATTE